MKYSTGFFAKKHNCSNQDKKSSPLGLKLGHDACRDEFSP